MVRLASMASERPIQKSTIAALESISPDYTEQILIKLKAVGFVTSHRGAKGGYTLARPASEITVYDVVKATEGSVILAPCLRDDCERENTCSTKPIWERANRALIDVLAGSTIEELAEEAKRREGVLPPLYSI